MRRAAPLSAKLVEETFDVVEVGSRAGLVLGLSLANLRQEELASQQCQLLLVTFVAVRVDDVCRDAGLCFWCLWDRLCAWQRGIRR